MLDATVRRLDMTIMLLHSWGFGTVMADLESRGVVVQEYFQVFELIGK